MGHRRYSPIGTEPVYDHHYDRLKMSSVVMNAESRHATTSHAGDYNDPVFVRSLKVTWEGNEEGKHFVPGTEAWRRSRIPGIKDKLTEVDEQFKHYQQRRVNEGNRRPEEMPTEMKEEKLKLEARLDIATEELDVINVHLSKIESKKRVGDDSKVLKHGPRGHGWLKAGILWEMDGQNVRLTNKDVLVIDDKRSPFDGMMCADYKEHIVRPWNIARLRLGKEQNKICKGLKGKERTPAMMTAWTEKQAELYEKNPEWKDLFSLKLDGKPNMPAWPDGIKNHFKSNGEKK